MHKSTGRNDPCPCGSGRKYKKCCLGRDDAARREEQAAALAEASESDWEEEWGSQGVLRPGHGGKDVLPYVRVKYDDQPPRGIHYLSPDERTGRRQWTPKKVARLATESIVSRLEKIGVAVTSEGFPAQTRGRQSAWTIGEDWRLRTGRELTAAEKEFLGLAACELWKRWAPDPPSLEMIDDWITEGEAMTQEHGTPQRLEGVRLWIRAWRSLDGMLDVSARTFDAVDEFWRGTDLFSNWISDLVIEMRNAPSKDRPLVEEGLRVLDELSRRFPEPDEESRLLWKESRADLHASLGDFAEAERLFREIIAARPDSAQGYVGLADLWSAPYRDDDRSPDHARAAAVLEEALAAPVEDAEDWDVEERLRDLYKRIGRKPATAPRPRPCSPRRSAPRGSGTSPPAATCTKTVNRGGRG